MCHRLSTMKVDARRDVPLDELNLDSRPCLVIEVMWVMLDCGHYLLGQTMMMKLQLMKRTEIAGEKLVWGLAPNLLAGN